MSSDYWQDDDSDYLEMLNNIVIPGEEPRLSEAKAEQPVHDEANNEQASQSSRKRPRSPTLHDRDSPTHHPSLSLVHQNKSAAGYMQSVCH